MSLDFQANYGQPWQYLGSTKLTAGANTTASVSFVPYDILLVQVWIPGYAGSDVGSLQFNGDTATNYCTRFCSNSAAAGTFTGVDTANNADTMIQLGLPTTAGRTSVIQIGNLATKSKVCDITTQMGTGTTTVGTVHLNGYGEWVNTTAQITSMLMKTHGGANMATGTGFVVYGRNF